MCVSGNVRSTHRFGTQSTSFIDEFACCALPSYRFPSLVVQLIKTRMDEVASKWRLTVNAEGDPVASIGNSWLQPPNTYKCIKKDDCEKLYKNRWITKASKKKDLSCKEKWSTRHSTTNSDRVTTTKVSSPDSLISDLSDKVRHKVLAKPPIKATGLVLPALQT